MHDKLIIEDTVLTSPLKKNNDSITNTSGILDFNEKENITNDYKKVLYDLYYDDEIN